MPAADQHSAALHSDHHSSITCQSRVIAQHAEQGLAGVQAIAASPVGAVNGYAIGSFLYLGIVYAFPLGLGLGGLSMDLPVSTALLHTNQPGWSMTWGHMQTHKECQYL